VIEVRHDTESLPSAIVFVDAPGESAQDLARLLRLAVRGGDFRLVVDLGERSDTSSDLLALLYRAGRQLRRVGGTLGVVCSQPDVRRLFHITLLSEAVPVFASRDEALRDWR
jgi:anti-anti-sigma factor